MTKTLLTIGLNDKDTEQQKIESPIVFENSIRVEIATDGELTEADAIIAELKKELNQESIMMEKETKEIFFK